MTGGLGDDTYVVDDAGDTTTEAAGGGTDTVQSAITFVLAAEIETLDAHRVRRDQCDRQRRCQHAHRQPRTRGRASAATTARRRRRRRQHGRRGGRHGPRVLCVQRSKLTMPANSAACASVCREPQRVQRNRSASAGT